MRIGTVLLVLVASWIALGYVLSDNINTHQDLAQAQQQTDRAIREKNAIQKQLDAASSKLAALEQQIGQLLEKIDILEGQLNGLQSENDGLKIQNVGLRSQLDQTKELNQLVGDLMGFLPQSPGLAILGPILSVPLAASLIIIREGRRSHRKPVQRCKSNHTMSIQVTEEEMQQIIKMRRRH